MQIQLAGGNLPNKTICLVSNPIHNLFAWVKLNLLKRRPKNFTKLKEELTAIWEIVNSDILENHWLSMPSADW